MLKAYDIAVKKRIEIFANKIPVVGLQNDDTSENSESVMSQTGLPDNKDISSFPVISVFRGPEITIEDGSKTKRVSTYLGYEENTVRGPAYLVAMRGSLGYTVDVFDTTRASAEKIALQLYFRLRNNPQIEADFYFKDFDYTASCIADIQMGEEISNVKVQDKSKAQVYKIRMTFSLINVNLYDILGKDPISEIKYKIDVNILGSDRLVQEEGPPVIDKSIKQYKNIK